jgi:hypothetical protein
MNMTTLTLDTHAQAASPIAAPVSGSKVSRWTGRVMTGLVTAFLLFDASIKLAQLEMVERGSRELGYPPETMLPIGLTLLACLTLHLIPRTAVLGAVLLTGYLGGAIATHVRVGNPLFSHVLFPIYVAALIWGGLYLRDRRVRALIGPQ